MRPLLPLFVGVLVFVLLVSGIVPASPRPSTSVASGTVGDLSVAAGAGVAPAVNGTPANAAWSEFRYNASHSGDSPLRGPSDAQLQWEVNGGSTASPVVDRARQVIAATPDGTLVAYTEASGIKQWTFSIPHEHRNFFSTPAIGRGGLVVVGSQDGTLYALKPTGGTFASQVVWTLRTAGPILSSPAIGPNGTVYVGSDDGRLYAASANGLLLWSFATGAPVQSSPAVGNDGRVYFGSNDGWLYALFPNGSLDWKFNATMAITSSPAVTPNGTVVVGGGDGTVYAVNSTGALEWSYATGGSIFSSPAIAPNGTVYVGSHDGKLYAFDANGSPAWNFTTGGPVYSSPALDARGDIFVGSDDGSLYALRSSGTPLWTFVAGGKIRASPAIGPDGTLFAATESPAGSTHVFAIHAVFIRFVEFGLPAGTRWQVTVAGSNHSSTHSMIGAFLPSGTLNWVTSTLACGTGCRYPGSSGVFDTTVTRTVSVQFVKEFKVELRVLPQGAGKTTPGQGTAFWWKADTNLSIAAHPFQFYQFANWSTSNASISIRNTTSSTSTAFIGAPGTIFAHLTPKIGAPRGVLRSGPPATPSPSRAPSALRRDL